MKTQHSAFTLIELVAVVIMLGLASVLFLPTLFKSLGVSNKHRCAKNLRAIGLGLIQYSNDHKYFPHMQALDAPNLATDVAKVYRTLIYFKYIDNPEVYVCPSSEDFPIRLDDSVIKDPRQFQWKSPTASGSTQAPILDPPPDPDLFIDPDFHQLSYTYRRKSLATSDARSDIIIAADKALREDFDAADTGTGTLVDPIGNHLDGYTILYGDGHVDYSKISEEALMTRMNQTLHLGTFEINCKFGHQEPASSTGNPK